MLISRHVKYSCLYINTSFIFSFREGCPISNLLSVVGAAAVWDYLIPVEVLPDKGGIVKVMQDCPAPLAGGCAPNTAAGVQKLCGCNPKLFYPIGSDSVADGVPDEWKKAGIDCGGVVVNENGHSGRSWIFTQPDGTTMCFAYPGVADATEPGKIGELGKWVVIAPVFNQFTRPILEEALRQNSHLVVTGICSPEIIPFLPKLHCLLVNQHEAEKLCGYLNKSTLQGLADYLPDTILYVTKGKRGSSLHYKGQVFEIPITPPEATVDVTGAGDAFTAGVVFGLMSGCEPVDSAYIGSCCASFAVQGLGGQAALADWPAVKKRLLSHAPGVINKISQIAGMNGNANASHE